MDQNQNPQQPNMQDPQNYQYNYNQVDPNLNQQVNQPNPYNQGYQANPYGQNQQVNQPDPYNQGYQANPYGQYQQANQADPYNQGYQANSYDQYQQANQTDLYNQGYQADPYGQNAATSNQQSFNMPDPFSPTYQQPMYASAAVKKKINPALIIVPAAIVIIAAVVVTLIIFLSGSRGYKGAEKKYFTQMIKGFSSSMSEASDQAKEPQLVTVSFDASNSQIADYIGFSDVTVTAETASKGDNIYALMSLEMGKEFIEGQLWYDEKKGEVMMRLPDISSIYIQASLSDSYGQDSLIDTEAALDAFADIISDTMDTYFEVVGDTEVDKGNSFHVGRESFTADKAKIKLTEAQVAVITKAFLENFINNDEAMDILCAYLDEDEDDVIEMLRIDESIDYLEDIIDDADEYSEVIFEMTVWIQGSNIVGREVELTSPYGYTAAEFAFYHVPTSNGTVTYFEMGDEFEIMCRDEVNGKLHSGSVTVTSYETEVMEMEYEDFAITDKLFQGEATIEFYGYNAFEVNLELETVGKTKEINVSVPNVCKVKVTSEPSKLKFEDMPNPSHGQVLSIDSSGDYDEEAMEEFLNDIYSYFGIGTSGAFSPIF